MNKAFFQLSDELKNEYYASFASEQESEIFLFLRKFLKFIEDDSSSFNVLIRFENPLKDEERRFFMKDLYRNCRRFLETRRRSTDDSVVAEALCYIGTAHEYGLFDYSWDWEEAFQQYLVSSQLNNALGTYRLAICFEKGIGTSRDYERALYFYRCAAKLGQVDGLHVYGAILANGYLGARMDQNTGLHYLSLASITANKMYPYPLYDIAGWYEKKQDAAGCVVDQRYALELYIKGAELGDPNSQYRLGRCYENGELETEACINKAVQWYKRAAVNGQSEAQLMLFGFYSSGVPGVLKKDSGASYYWALRAGIRGNARAVFFLGEYARSGIGIEEDILLALWWYTISASMGSYEGRMKMQQTKSEIERRDIGPEIPYRCCGITCFIKRE